LPTLPKTPTMALQYIRKKVVERYGREKKTQKKEDKRKRKCKSLALMLLD
jgi:hypothetical protein